MSELEQFKFHPTCKDMRLTHLCFADDLILYCKGEFESIYLMLRAFKLFSKASGLQANTQKSAMYSCGMDPNEKQRAAEISGFAQESLPFKYLRVSISARIISAAQCEVLIDKMIVRIRVWSSRNPSYTARVQLINSVLLSLHMYWAQVFLLPKKILQQICSICDVFVEWTVLLSKARCCDLGLIMQTKISRWIGFQECYAMEYSIQRQICLGSCYQTR